MANRFKAIASELLQRYQQRKARGELRVDDKLYLDLCQMLPEKAAQEIIGRFRQRRAHSNPKPEGILLGDRDRAARCRALRIDRQADPLTDADEDAMLLS